MSVKNIPVYYNYQNRNDKSTNVFVMPNYFSDLTEIKIKHVIMFFPHQLEGDINHFRFKIQCEKPQKQLAWLDIMNMNAKAPTINGAIYVKILELQQNQESKIYTREKLSGIYKIKQEEINRLKAKLHGLQNKTTTIDDQPPKSAPKSQTFNKQMAQQQQSQNKQNKDNQNETRKRNDEPQQVQKEDNDLFSFSPKGSPKNGKQKKDSQDVDPDDWGLGDQNEEVLQQGQTQVWGNKQDEIKTNGVAPPPAFSSNNDLIDTAGPSVYDENTGEYKTREQLKQEKLDKVEKGKQEKLDAYRLEVEQQKQKQLQREKIEDELKSKVQNWAMKDKQRQNIRKLLSSVHEILWPGCQWKQLSLSELLDDSSVKKAYFKALLQIHPDKNVGKGQEVQYLGETIIREIQIAWNEYRDQKK